MISKVQKPEIHTNVFEKGYTDTGVRITIVRRECVSDVLASGYIIRVSSSLWLKSDNDTVFGTFTHDLSTHSGYWEEAKGWLRYLTASISELRYSQSIYKEVNGVYHGVSFSNSATEYKSKLKVPKEST